MLTTINTSSLTTSSMRLTIGKCVYHLIPMQLRTVLIFERISNVWISTLDDIRLNHAP